MPEASHVYRNTKQTMIVRPRPGSYFQYKPYYYKHVNPPDLISILFLLRCISFQTFLYFFLHSSAHPGPKRRSSVRSFSFIHASDSYLVTHSFLFALCPLLLALCPLLSALCPLLSALCHSSKLSFIQHKLLINRVYFRLCRYWINYYPCFFRRYNIAVALVNNFLNPHFG